MNSFCEVIYAQTDPESGISAGIDLTVSIVFDKPIGNRFESHQPHGGLYLSPYHSPQRRRLFVCLSVACLIVCVRQEAFGSTTQIMKGS